MILSIVLSIVFLLIGMMLDIFGIKLFIASVLEPKNEKEKFSWQYTNDADIILTYVKKGMCLNQTLDNYDKKYNFNKDSKVEKIEIGKLTQYIYLIIDGKNVIIKNNLKI